MKKCRSILCGIMLALSMTFSASCSSGEKSPDMPMNEAKFSEDGKPVVTIGIIGYTDDLLKTKNALARPKDIVIETVDYYDGIDNELTYKEQRKAVQQKIDADLISGNAPDIIIADSEIIYRLNRIGALSDLYQLMDQYDDGIKKEDFTDCALEGLTIDGKMPAILENYCIKTAVAKTEFVGKEYENWTAADAMKFYGTVADDQEFCEFFDESSLADYMMKLEGINCVDMTNNTCNFSGAFTELLDFCKQNPIQVRSWESTDTFDEFRSREWECAGLNDAYLVYKLSINGFNSSLASSTFGYLNKADLTFVGYPSENGCGAYITPAIDNGLMGICSQSSNKEAAWELLNKMIKHRVRKEQVTNSDVMGIPVFKSEWDYYYDLPSDYASSINSDSIYAYDGSHYNSISITQEYKDMLRDYILSVPVNPYTPQSIEYIIEEECDPVILDNRSAEEAASILQNRIETYLSEKT